MAVGVGIKGAIDDEEEEEEEDEEEDEEEEVAAVAAVENDEAKAEFIELALLGRETI